ncbi:MAG: T9SS type A sorting domain-containing protein, partial [Saprospiraceae bacterium]
DGVTTLSFGEGSRMSKNISVTNMLGQVIDQWELSEYVDAYAYTTDKLTAGIYFITVTSGNRYFTRKLIK